jgi:lactoylglutathione lyase
MSDPATAGFVFNHTMLRVKDLDASLDFYTRVLGFTPIDRREFPQWAFTLQFLALGVDPADIPADAAARRGWMARREGLLELTHNHGTQTDPDFAYHDGNSDPRGFGHICVAVPRPGRGIPKAAGPGWDEIHRLHQGPRRLLDRDYPAHAGRLSASPTHRASAPCLRREVRLLTMPIPSRRKSR